MTDTGAAAAAFAAAQLHSNADWLPVPGGGGRLPGGGGRRASCGVIELRGALGLGGACPSDAPVQRHQGREQAETALRTAMEKNNPLEMLSALIEAKSTGADKALVQDATRLLQRLQAREALQAAVAARDAGHLRAALVHAKSAGIEPKEVASAERLWKVLEIEDSLNIAITMRESGALRLALSAACGSGASSALIEKGQQLLAMLELGHSLAAAARSRNPKKLQEALDKAEKCNLPPATLEHARALLAELSDSGKVSPTDGALTPDTGALGGDTAKTASCGDRAADARSPLDEIEQRIWRAVNLRESGALKMAIDSAAGITVMGADPARTKALIARRDAMLDVARRTLGEIESARALALVVKRIGPNSDRKKLKEAITQAESFGLTPVTSEDLARAMAALEHIDAQESLSAALKAKTVADIEAAIARCRAANVDRTRVDRAEKTLIVMKAKDELDAAAARKDPLELPGAIEAARRLGVERGEIERAEKLLQPERPRRSSFLKPCSAAA